jgi:hypothetical protein
MALNLNSRLLQAPISQLFKSTLSHDQELVLYVPNQLPVMTKGKVRKS